MYTTITKTGPRRLDPVIQDTSRLAYNLRRERKTWKQIAGLTGVTMVYSSGNFKIEARARKYAQKHNLPWPPSAKEE